MLIDKAISKAKQKEQGGNDYWKPRFPIAELPVIKPEQSPDNPADNPEREDGQQEGVMKKMREVIFEKGQRDKYPGILKGGGAMFKKLLNMMILGALVLTASSLVKPVYASGSCSAYIVLTCTTTLSVSLVLPNTWFNLGTVSAGTTVYSSDGVVFRNDSVGAVCMWDLNIEPSSLGGWTLANNPGLNQVAIYGVFATSQASAVYDMVNDTFSVTGKTYNGATGVFACGSYTAAQGSGIESRIVPSSMNGMGSYTSDRKLCIKMLTPLAVTDQTQRIISIVVTAQMAG